MDKKLFSTLLAFAALLGAVLLVYQIVAPFLVAIGWAAVITIVTYPLYRRLLGAVGGREALAASLMTLAVVLLLVLPTIWLTIVIVQELLRAQQLLETAGVERGGFPGLKEVLAYPPIANLLERLEALAGQAGVDLRARTLQAAQGIVQFVLTTMLATIKNLALFVFQLLLVLIATFFLYKDGLRLERWLWGLVSVPSGTRQSVREATGSMVSAVVIGVLVTAAAQGFLGGIGFWFCGLPSPVLFGVLMAASALVPVVGSALVWVPGVAYLFISGDVVYGIVLLVWSIVAVSGVDNILRPVLISGRTGLPLSLMLLGAIGGLIAFGLFGLVVGPLTLALVVLLARLRHPTTEMLPANPAPRRRARSRAVTKG
jgi:predicted PurR-regulated permease PerM